MPGCASKQDWLELATIRYKKLTPGEKMVRDPFSYPVRRNDQGNHARTHLHRINLVLFKNFRGSLFHKQDIALVEIFFVSTVHILKLL